MLILFRTTGDGLFFSFFRQWDVLLPLVVYFGQRRNLVEGLTLTLLGAHLYSLCSAAPIGLFLLLYLAIFLGARGLTSILYANRFFSIFLLLLVLGLSDRIFLFFLSGFFEKGTNSFWMGGMLPLVLLANALGGYCVYQCLGILDYLTGKLPAIKIQLSEGYQ